MTLNESKYAKKVILIVDDEPELLTSLKKPLKTKYQIVTTTKSSEVLKILQTEVIACILIDIRMPGMVGIELLKEIKFKHPHLPILMMTNPEDENDTITTLRLGASGYLKKPIDINLLFQEIDRVTSSSIYAHPRKEPAKIFLVGEDVELIENIKRAMKIYPYEIITSTVIDESLQITKKINFDIIIIDAQMQTMNYFEFLQNIRKVQNDFIPIIITTSSSQDLTTESMKQNIFDYIHKPVNVGDMICAIERSMHKLDINRQIFLKNQELTKKEKILEKLNDEILMQKNFLENIVKSISNMLIVTDNKGIIKTINDATLKILGYEANELINKPLDIIISVDDFKFFMKHLAEEKSISNIESELTTKDGNIIFVLFSGSLIRSRSDVIDGFVFVAQDISKHKFAAQELHRLSYYDTLTGLPNRLHFEMRAKQALITAEKSNMSVAFLYIDLDGFKSVNDRLGHPVGDALLKEVALRLQNGFRANDFIARIGGDEFAAYMDKVNDKTDVGLVAQRLINSINKPYYIENNELIIGTSVGIALYPESSTDFHQLFKNADVALYKAKAAGRNQYQFFTKQLDEESSQQLDLEHALRFALRRGEFHLVYQPIFSLKTREIISFETLLRWDNPDFGSISPDIFIPTAEFNGLIVPIGEWMMENAIKQFSTWRKKYKKDFKLSLNISAYQLDRSKHLTHILQLFCKQAGVPPNSIILELTETSIIHNSKQAEQILLSLHRQGFIIALDDFGQGYSSLNLLSRLPISILKIDKQFINDISDLKNEYIINSIITLSKGLSVTVIAEGIENEAQLKYLLDHGCELGQGYYFCNPERAEKLVDYLE